MRDLTVGVGVDAFYNLVGVVRAHYCETPWITAIVQVDTYLLP